MSVYGEPNSPARVAMMAAKEAIKNAPKGFARFEALQRYERARATAVLAARESAKDRKLNELLGRLEQLTPTQRIASQLVSRINRDAYTTATTHSGQIASIDGHTSKRSANKNSSVFDVFPNGSKGGKPFSPRYRENSIQTPEISSLLASGFSRVSNGKTRKTAYRHKRAKHRPDYRHPLGRPVRQGREQWVSSVGWELRRFGLDLMAEQLETCGRKAQVWDCSKCGETNAAIGIVTTCNVRVCPWCARRDSQRRVAALEPAIAIVGEFMEWARDRVATSIDVEIDRAQRAQDFWSKRYDQARSEKTAAFCREKLAKALRREEIAVYQLHRVRDSRWSWKLFTISPQWQPNEHTEYTVARLRQRVMDVQQRWRNVWRWLGVRGLSSAVETVEISDRGHIHLHALVYCPYVVDSFIRELAGCMVDIRDADNGAAKEVAKYSSKIISPLSAQWMSGQRRNVIHPVLAARWMMATRKVHLKAVRGLPLKQALRATAPPPTNGDCKSELPQCVRCDAPIETAPRTEDVWFIAHEQTLAAESALSAMRKQRWLMQAQGMTRAMVDGAIPMDARAIVVVRRLFWSARLHITFQPQKRVKRVL